MDRQGSGWRLWTGVILLAALVLWTIQLIAAPSTLGSLLITNAAPTATSAPPPSLLLASADFDHGNAPCEGSGDGQSIASCGLASCAASPTAVMSGTKSFVPTLLPRARYRFSPVVVPRGFGVSPSLPPPRVPA